MEKQILKGLNSKKKWDTRYDYLNIKERFNYNSTHKRAHIVNNIIMRFLWSSTQNMEQIRWFLHFELRKTKSFVSSTTSQSIAPTKNYVW